MHLIQKKNKLNGGSQAAFISN